MRVCIDTVGYIGVMTVKEGDYNMKIGFIGAGKVGFSLGKHLALHGICVEGYYSRNIYSSKEAAEFTKSKFYTSLDELVNESDTLFLTVPDGDLVGVYSEIIRLDISGKCIIHCSGAMSSEVFFDIESRGASGCSVHPICAVNDKYTGYLNLSDAYFTVESKNENTALMFGELLHKCGNNAKIITPENKVKYHAAAVFASNLVTGLYDAATELFEECGLDEEFSKEALGGLFLGNAKNVASLGVKDALTGPVERGDAETVKKHIDVLDGEMKNIYLMLSRRLLKIAERKNSDRSYEDLKRVLQ